MMKNAILNRMEELSTEAAKLMQQLNQHEAAIKEIETRLHQITGALTELDQMSRSKQDGAAED